MCPREAPEEATESTVDVPPVGRTIASATLDKRTREAKRRAEIIEAYRSEIGAEADEPLLASRIAEAAELKVIAEACRASLMKGNGRATANDVVRATRAASLAERALGIDRRKNAKAAAPSLREKMLAKKAAAEAASAA